MPQTQVQPDTPASESHEPQANVEPTDVDVRDEKQVPVSEAIRYRKRAQAAEQELGEVRAQMQTLQHQLAESRQTLDHLERRQRIDALLAESEAIDLDAARLLTERAVQEMDEPDVKAAVDDLKRHKPYLFRRRASQGHGAMAPQVGEPDAPVAEELAHRAAVSGHRRDLLRYLRLRRQKT